VSAVHQRSAFVKIKSADLQREKLALLPPGQLSVRVR
jgi:hypothetical protein